MPLKLGIYIHNKNGQGDLAVMSIEKYEEILEKCDDVFYENEEMINGILERFCKEAEIWLKHIKKH